MARSCQCWKTYTCLLCEDIANGIVKIVENKVVRVNRFPAIGRITAECGTRAGYNKHRRDGEPACDECKSAQNEAVKEFNKRKRERTVL